MFSHKDELSDCHPLAILCDEGSSQSFRLEDALTGVCALRQLTL